MGVHRLLLIFVIFFIFTSSFVFSNGIWHSFNWEDKNPFITGMESTPGAESTSEYNKVYIWDTAHFDTIFYNAHVSDVNIISNDRLSAETQNRLDKLSKNLDDLSDMSVKCKHSQEELRDTYEYMKNNSEYFQNCSSFSSRIASSLISLIPIVGPVYNSVEGVECILSYIHKNEGEAKYNELLDNLKDCSGYGKAWKNDADILYNFVYSTSNNYNSLNQNLNICYNLLVYDYKVYNFSDDNVKDDFNTFDYNYSSLNCSARPNSQVCIWKGRLNSLREGTQTIDPNFSNFSFVESEYWKDGGVRSELIGLQKECKGIQDHSDYVISRLSMNVNNKLTDLSKCTSNLNLQKLELFNGNFSATQFLSGNRQASNINKNYALLNSNYDSLNSKFQAINNNPYIPKGDKDQILSSLYKSASANTSACNNLSKMAAQTVDLLKQKLMSDSDSLHADDKNYILSEINNVKSKTLGERYQRYMELFVYISDRSKNPMVGYDTSQIGLLIERAKKDNIDTSYEEFILKDLKVHWDPNMYNQIVNSIYFKADTKYFYLPSERSELISDFRSVGATDLVDEMKIYENSLGFDFTAGFSIRNAIGHLQDITVKYTDLKKQLTNEERERLKNNDVTVYKDTFMAPVPIGEDSNVSVNLYVYNYHDYDVFNSTYISDLDIQNVILSNQSMGLASLIPSPNNKLIIKFNEVPKYSNIRVLLRGKYKSTHMLSHTADADADIYNIGRVDDKYRFVAYKDTSINVDPSGSCVVDGYKQAVNGVIPVQKGNHNLVCKRDVHPAYDLNLTAINVSKTQFTKQICYNVNVLPNDDFSQATVLLSNVGGTDLSYNKDIHLSSVKSGVDGVVLSLKDLEKNSEVHLKLCTSISNVSDYIYDQISYYSLFDLDSKGIAYLNKARMYYNQGKYSSALLQITNLQSYYNNYAKNSDMISSATNETLNKIHNETQLLTKVLVNLSTSNDSYLKNLVSNHLSDIKKLGASIKSKVESGDMNGAYKLSKKYDPNWLSNVMLDYYGHVEDTYTHIKNNLADNGFDISNISSSTLSSNSTSKNISNDISKKMDDFSTNPTLPGALDLQKTLDSVDKDSQDLISQKSEARNKLIDQIHSLMSDIKLDYSSYFSREYALNPDYFRYTPSYVQSELKLKDTDKYTIAGLNRAIKNLKDIKASIYDGMDSLKQTTVSSYTHLFTIYSNMSKDDPAKPKLKNELELISHDIKSKKYGSALQSIKKELANYNGGGSASDDNGLAYLSLIALIGLGGILGYVYYMYSKKSKHGKPPKRLSKEI